VAAIGTLLAFAWMMRRSPRICVASLIGVALLGTAGGLVPIPTQGSTSGGPDTVTAAVVQGSVPGVGLDFLGQREAVLANHVKETLVLADDVRRGKTAKPDFVIWPENSTDIDPLTDPAAGALIQQAVDAIDVPILVGAVVNVPSDPTHVWNAGIVWMPTNTPTPGPTTYYVKQHPVPFGEYIPMRSLIANVNDRLARISRDFAAGESTGVLQLGPARIGDLICFEVAYDSLGQAAATGQGVQGPLTGHGARIMTIQTNNATYAHTGQPEQQLAMSRLRAIEHGRTVLIASTSGISAIIRPDGSFAGELGESGAGYLVAKVPLRDEMTISDRLGGWPEAAAVVVAVALVLAAGLLNRRDRRVGSTVTPISTQEPVRDI
jgi:apolipoprotein N-acyltransferase